MNRSLRLTATALIISLLLLSTPAAAFAFPPLPSSFYGTVKLNAANLPDGTLIEALIDSKVIAFSQTETYQGSSIYSLDVAGDDNSTPAVVEGGVEGDRIQFRIGGILAGQTAVWHSATNIELNLNVSSGDTPLPPQPTSTRLPTQTPITVPPTPRPPTRTAIARTQAVVAPMLTQIFNTQAVVAATQTAVPAAQTAVQPAAATPAAPNPTPAQAGTPQAAGVTPAASAPVPPTAPGSTPMSASTDEAPAVTEEASVTETAATETAVSSALKSKNFGLVYWITIPTLIASVSMMLLVLVGVVWFLRKKK